MERIFLDSCIVIYLVERHPLYEPRLREKLEGLEGAELAVSPLVRLEVLVRPLRDGDEELVQLYRLFLAEQLMLDMSEEVYDAALTLRAEHMLKTPDALHLATAQYHGCTQFWTNDDRLATKAGGLAFNILAAEQPE